MPPSFEDVAPDDSESVWYVLGYQEGKVSPRPWAPIDEPQHSWYLQGFNDARGELDDEKV